MFLRFMLLLLSVTAISVGGWALLRVMWRFLRRRNHRRLFLARLATLPFVLRYDERERRYIATVEGIGRFYGAAPSSMSIPSDWFHESGRPADMALARVLDETLAEILRLQLQRAIRMDRVNQPIVNDLGD